MICNTNQPTSFQSIEPLTSNGLRVYSQKDLINKFTEQAPHPPYDSGPLKWKPINRFATQINRHVSSQESHYRQMG